MKNVKEGNLSAVSYNMNFWVKEQVSRASLYFIIPITRFTEFWKFKNTYAFRMSRLFYF